MNDYFLPLITERRFRIYLYPRGYSNIPILIEFNYAICDNPKIL